jgi:hypothetical protein
MTLKHAEYPPFFVGLAGPSLLLEEAPGWALRFAKMPLLATTIFTH